MPDLAKLRTLRARVERQLAVPAEPGMEKWINVKSARVLALLDVADELIDLRTMMDEPEWDTIRPHVDAALKRLEES